MENRNKKAITRRDFLKIAGGAVALTAGVPVISLKTLSDMVDEEKIEVHAVAINGSPRKNWNTDTLLQKALEGAKSAGAQTEIIHLHDLQFKGCSSCFACKRKDFKMSGHCIMKDDLTDILEKILKCNVLLLGSPVYFGNITGGMQCFLERLLFSNLSYNEGRSSVFEGNISSGFIFTMNMGKDQPELKLFEHYRNLLTRLGKTSEILLAKDTYQFDDYSKYEASRFSEPHKAKIRAEQFPIDCQNASEMGVMLVKSAATYLLNR
jgi:multimeric flavodoxin WrbA